MQPPAFIHRHKQALKVAVESIGVTIAWRVIASVLAASAASAAITAVATEQHAAYRAPFSLSTKGAAFIARYEGTRLTPYNDPFNCTVGTGHLIHMGPCSSFDYLRWRITSKQALALLIHDAGTAENYVRGSVTHPISQPQFDALVDLTFNIGGGGLQRSSALRFVNAGNFSAVPAALRVWSYANGRFLQGLYNRRIAEGDLFTRGFYGSGIGFFVPAKPTPPPDPRRVPKPVPTWAWKWAEWELGRGPYRGHAGKLGYRPKAAPRPVPKWAWVFLSRFTRVSVR